MEKIIREDRDTLTNIRPIIIWCEDQGMDQSEVLKWIEENAEDYKIHALIYYAYQNAGAGNPLLLDPSEIDLALLESK